MNARDTTHAPATGHHSKLQRAIEVGAITAFFCLTLNALVRIADLWMNDAVRGAGWIVGAALVGGLLFADFISGVVHWAADNWGEESWPLVGPGLIRPFREHHVDPQDITRHDFVELNGNNCLVSLLTFWWGDLGTHGSTTAALFWLTFWLSVAWWVFATNQFHAWAHAEQPPAAVRALQRYRLILSQDHHAVHHTAPHNGHYCITTGWMNKPLTVLRFFPVLERAVFMATGIRPRHYIAAHRTPSFQH